MIARLSPAVVVVASRHGVTRTGEFNFQMRNFKGALTRARETENAAKRATTKLNSAASFCVARFGDVSASHRRARRALFLVVCAQYGKILRSFFSETCVLVASENPRSGECARLRCARHRRRVRRRGPPHARLFSERVVVVVCVVRKRLQRHARASGVRFGGEKKMMKQTISTSAFDSSTHLSSRTPPSAGFAGGEGASVGAVRLVQVGAELDGDVRGGRVVLRDRVDRSLRQARRVFDEENPASFLSPTKSKHPFHSRKRRGGPGVARILEPDDTQRATLKVVACVQRSPGEREREREKLVPLAGPSSRG